MPRDFPHLAARLFGTPLLIDERKLDAIVPAFMRRLNGEDDAPGDGGGDYREPGEPRYANGVAVIPVIGSLVRRKSMMDAWSGLTSYSDIATCLRCALDDPRVRAILLQVDSFGGEASGCFELCDELYAARGRKPIWAVGDVDALSAGYAILAQADRVLVAPSGSAGSIGAVAVHCERSQFNEAMGYTYTVFRAGTRKAELNSLEPITKAAAEKVAASLAKVRDGFISSVVRARKGLTARAARDTEGQFFDADDALRLKLVDGLQTYEATFAELTASVAVVEPARAPAQPPAPVEDEEDEEEAAPAVETAKLEEITMTDAEKAAAIAAAATTAAPAVTPTAAAPAPPAPAANPADNVVSLDVARAEGTATLRAQQNEISELCGLAGKPGEALGFILGGKSVAEVRKALTDARAADAAKAGEISGLHQPGQPHQAAAGPSVATAEDLASWDRAFDRVQGKVS
jgi:ClpP class serine protease